MGAFNALGVADGEQLEHKMLSNAIETAQEKTGDKQLRYPSKNLLEYDQVMNEQERSFTEREEGFSTARA